MTDPYDTLLDSYKSANGAGNYCVYTPLDAVEKILKEKGLLPKQKVQKTGYYVYADLGTNFDFCATPEEAWEAWEKHLRFFPEDKDKGVLVTHTWEAEE